ncbi:DUF1254 domain-containing protein [Psychromonas aquimarina]|uniref:DUF1254 domain-containing protein n=1 Tax=Psychromonas aquimarina TaxID=444919 RepID=UPI00041628A3|nr:DUF1254 domain-containing protein [Psychromonas aquimarina]
MKKTLLAVTLAGTFLCTPLFASPAPVTPLTEATKAVATQDTRQLAQLAYEYAFSIDEAYKYFYETVVKEDYPLNQFQNIRILADDTYTAHPTINNDTLHLMGWMDLGAEPVIITVPDHDEGRYWLFHTMNMQHFTDSAFGSPDRGSKGGIFMYAVEGWEGEVPASVDEVIYVEHPLVKMMGRIMDLGGDDSPKAQKLMDQWSVRTLSEFLGQKGPKPKQRNYPNPEETNWVERTNFILAEGTMRQHDAELINMFAQFGLGAPQGTLLTKQQQADIEQAQKDGYKHIENAPFNDSRDLLGTREEMTAVPSYQHAYGTLLGQWGLPAEHTMYTVDFLDAEGEKLDGSKYDYSITFQAPDVDSFWSYTAYSNKTRLMEYNELNRHSRGDRTLKANADGSYTINMSSNTKGKESDPNFLPIPNHDWYAILRMYTPGSDVRNDIWQAPKFQKIEKK